MYNFRKRLLVLYIEINFHTFDSRKFLAILSFGKLFTSAVPATWH